MSWNALLGNSLASSLAVCFALMGAEVLALRMRIRHARAALSQRALETAQGQAGSAASAPVLAARGAVDADRGR